MLGCPTAPQVGEYHLLLLTLPGLALDGEDSGFILCLEDGAGGGGDTGPELGALLGDRATDGGALHLALRVDDDTGVV